MAKGGAMRDRLVLAAGVAAVLHLAGAALCVMLLRRGDVGFALLGLVVVLSGAGLTFAVLVAMASRESGRTDEKLTAITKAVEEMASHASLSDDARRVLRRNQERELLRQAIEEDIHSANFDAAMVLVREMADRFGFRADAEHYRSRIDQMRRETLERELSSAVQVLDGLIAQQRWDAAAAHAGSIQRLYPDAPKVAELPERVRQAQAAYKSELERRFLIAAQDGLAEQAMAILKQLDFYLTPQEAEPLRELARGVIGKARENLGAQFKLAVQDRRWREAARLGEQIIEEFPNTRMAGEVRDVIDGVRTRAAEAEQALGAGS